MLRLRGVNKRFEVGVGRWVGALKCLDFEVRQGEFVVMVGENGSGKSTLFRVITGEVFPDSGQVWFGDVDASRMPPHKRAKYVTHIQQSRNCGLPLSLTVEEVMRLAFESRLNAGSAFDSRRGESRDLLEEFRPGLSRVLKEQIWHLSGGEHQLISLAVASIFADGEAKGSHVLLLDEHVSQLDPVAHDIVMDASDKLIRERNLSAVMATHNCELAARYGDRQIILSRGRIAQEFVGASRLTSPEVLKQCMAAAARESDTTNVSRS